MCCFDENEGFNGIGVLGYPPERTLVACGYDKHCYISTAGLAPFPFTTQALIQAKLGGLIKLIEACDDGNPGTGDLTGDTLAVYNSVIQNVTTEINGYLSSIYPVPLAQTGTVAIIQVTAVSSDGLGTITAISVIESGNYSVAPSTTNAPAYLRQTDPLDKAQCSMWNNFNCQTGKGASLTVAYTAQSPFLVTGTPAIASGGTGYNVNDILVLTGGASFVPLKVQESALILICHSFYQRRLAPDEKNNFDTLAKFWRKELVDIGHGEMELEGTFKRNFSPVVSWNQTSMLRGNSL